jgi:hypothetical protein
VTVTLAITYAVMMELGFFSKFSSPISVNLPALSQQGATTFPEASSPSKPLPSKPVRPMEPLQSAPPAPLSREPHRSKGEISQGDLKINIPVENKTSLETKPSVEMKPSVISMDEKKVDQNVILEKSMVVPEITKDPVEPISTGASSTPPPIKISAIVWYQDPTLRFAMINGIKATEGSFIEGVKVVEIYPTSIRFFHNDQYFEISAQK